MHSRSKELSMNTTPLTSHQANAEYNRVREAARRRANELRREAANAFLDGIGHAALRATRAATRLLARKARHQRLRAPLEA